MVKRRRSHGPINLKFNIQLGIKETSKNLKFQSFRNIWRYFTDWSVIYTFRSKEGDPMVRLTLWYFTDLSVNYTNENKMNQKDFLHFDSYCTNQDVLFKILPNLTWHHQILITWFSKQFSQFIISFPAKSNMKTWLAIKNTWLAKTHNQYLRTH